MAVITVAQTGAWSDTATWDGGVLPASTDTISCLAAYTLTVDGNYTIAGGIIARGGKVVMGSGSKLTVNTAELTFGDSTAPRISYLELGPGAEIAISSTVKFYACAIASVGTTKANPARFTGAGTITSTALYRGSLDVENVLFLMTGSVSLNWSTGGTEITGPYYKAVNCVFTGPTYTFGSATTNIVSLQLNNCDFREAAVTVQYNACSGVSEVKNTTASSTDVKMWTINAKVKEIDFTGSVFENVYVAFSSTTGPQSLKGIFSAIRTTVTAKSNALLSYSDATPSSEISGSYFYHNGPNHRVAGLASTATTAAETGQLIDVKNNVLELVNDGNPFVIGPVKTAISNNLMIGRISPWASRAYASPGTPRGLSVEHNTQSAVQAAADPCLVGWEQAEIAYPGPVDIRSNLVSFTGTPNWTWVSLGVERGATINDPVNSVGHNAYYNVTTNKYSWASIVEDLTANDITLDSPMTFVDDTRNLATWGATQGGAGTVDDSINLLLSINGYNSSTGKQDGSVFTGTVADLVAWVRAGFAPTNSALLNAGHDGVTIGAMEYVSADDTAPNLTDAMATATGPTTATASVTTDDGNGTLYFLASENATETAATVKAALSQSVTAVGEQSVSLSALDPETTYYVHFVQINGASLESESVVSTAAFTTDAIAVKGATITLHAGTTPQASITDIVALWWDATTPSGAPAYSTTTASTDESGVLTLDLDATTALSIGDSGFLLLYKLDATDHRDSLVFAGRVTIEDIS